MIADQQLLIECETIISKVSLDCNHAVYSHMAWYKDACNKDDDKKTLLCEGWLRKSLLRAEH